MKCNECECVPSGNNEIYFEIRTSTSGRDLTEGLTDQELCQDCLETWIATNGLSTVVSLVRIENPLLTTGVNA